jgi:hypothetical protein
MLSYNEFILNEKLIEEQLYEKLDFKVIKNMIKFTVSDLKINLKFVGTFGTLLTVFIPIATKVMETAKFSFEISTSNVILLSIGALIMLVDNNKEDLQKIVNKFEDNSIITIIEKIANIFKNLKQLFIIVAKEFGKVVKSLSDMAAYAFISVPMLKLFLDFVQENNIHFDDLQKMTVTTGTGIAILAGKNITEYLIIGLSKKIHAE